MMSRTYDARGKMIETTQYVSAPTPHTIWTRYVYDPAGRLTHIVDPGGNDLGASYDPLGRKTAVRDPDRGDWAYAWDGLGRLRHQTDARLAVVGQEYDGIGRPVRRTVTGTNGISMTDTIWYYDQNGQYGVLSAVETGDYFRRDWRYDALLRPFKITTQLRADDDALAANSIRSFTVEYGYDNAFGRLKAVRLPSATAGQPGEAFALDYDGRGHAVGETQLVNYVRAKQYRRVKGLTPRGQVAQQVFGNCVAETTGHDEAAGLTTFLTALRPTLQTVLPSDLSSCSSATGLVRQLDYAHDHFLNLEQQSKNLPGKQATERYTYDELQRLKTSTRTWPATPAYSEVESYGYDDLGNLTSKSDYGLTYTYGSSARTTRWAGPHAVASIAKRDGSTATFDYDKNGNMVGGDGRTIEFDLLDKPVRVIQGATTTNFAYGPDGGRYRQRVWNAGDGFGPRTVYYVDKDYELVVWNKTATRTTPLLEERSYVGPAVTVYRQLPNPREVRYLHLDRLGSTEAVTPDTPAATAFETHAYDPFGKPRAADFTPITGDITKEVYDARLEARAAGAAIGAAIDAAVVAGVLVAGSAAEGTGAVGVAQQIAARVATAEAGAAGGAVASGTATAKVAIQFGRAQNQVEHAFRHTDALGLERAAVQSAIEASLRTVAAQVQPGRPFNQVIELSGIRLQYTAFRLADGVINVGRIHKVP